jgi:hypothetical protein
MSRGGFKSLLVWQKEFAELDTLCEEIAKMLRGLIKARSPHV